MLSQLRRSVRIFVKSDSEKVFSKDKECCKIEVVFALQRPLLFCFWARYAAHAVEKAVEAATDPLCSGGARRAQISPRRDIKECKKHKWV